MHGAARRIHQLAHQRIAHGVLLRSTALVDLAQAVLQCFHQRLAAIGAVQQVVLQVGIALDDPDVPSTS